jgi:hypothetical protein
MGRVGTILKTETRFSIRAGEAEMDEMWSYVRRKTNPRWLWHAIDHHTGAVLAYVFGRRKDEVFLKLKALLEPFGITHYYTDKYLSKINFIFISKTPDHPFDILNQRRKISISPEFDPFILHKPPENLYQIQFWRIFGKIENR